MSTTTTIEDRLTRVEAQLDRIAQLLESQTNGVLQNATTQAGEALANIYGDAEVRERVGELVLRLGEPETIEAFTRIGVLLPQIEYALHFAAAGPELVDEGLEMVRTELARSGTDSADMNQRTQAAVEALLTLSKPGTLRSVAAASEAITGATPAVEALGAATRAVADVEGDDAFRARMAETLTRLIEAETLDSLGRIAALAPQIEYAVNALAAGPEVLEEGLEMVREKLAREGTTTHDLNRRLDAGAEALIKVSNIDSLNALGHLGEVAPALSPFVEAAARTGRMLAEYEGEDALTDRLAESFLRITEPETLDALTRVAALTPQIEFAVNALAAGPEVLEEALESVRDWAAKNGQSTHELNQRTEAALDATMTLTDPKVLHTLTSLLPLLPPLRSTLVQLAENAGRIDLEPLVQLGESATDPDVTRALNELVRLAPNLAPALSSLPIQPHTLQILRTVNEAVEQAATEKASVGLFGAIGALNNRKVQRALGFALQVAERLGDHLESDSKKIPART